MIPSYIQDWLDIIEKMVNDNTYKPCFGRALIECINNNEFKEVDNEVIIDFDSVSKNMLHYYWNQIFFFNLKQSSNNKKPPVICQIVNKMIDKYKDKSKSVIPLEFDIKTNNKIINVIGNDFFNNCVKESSKVIPQNVLYRFLNCGNETKEVYRYDIKYKQIIFDQNQIILLKAYGVIISKLLNYKWAQLLEKYNSVPRIVNKVQSIAENKIRRSSLSKYKEQLLKEFDDGKIIDFYTGKEIKKEDISIDHVIPWSFMYSDDIWNLVVTSKSNNSKKSNIIPSDEVIQKLKERNNNIVNKLDSKYQLDLEEANKESLIDKYYYQCRL